MEEEVNKKKKKSVRLEQTDNCDRNLCRKKKKKHKEKDREKVEFQEDTETKKRKHDSCDSVSLSQELDSERKCKKKKHKHRTEDDKEMVSLFEDESVKKKKKKKQKKFTKDIQEDMHATDKKNKKDKLKKKKRKHEDHGAMANTNDLEHNNFTNGDTVKKKCKKKSKLESNDNDVETGISAKKNKKCKENDESLCIDNNKVPVDDTCTPVKKKKRKHQDLDKEESEKKTSEKETKKLHKNKKSVKKNELNNEGKTDQIKSNEDAYNNSENSKTLPVTAKNTVPVSGQWSTSSLGSDERQQKFLRLLGGFKKEGENKILSGTTQKRKGLFGSLGQQGGNYAMDAKQEEIYSSNMTTQYEKAMSMNLQRGIGLGYEPPPGAGKKFHIDETKSKSIKFDD